MHKKYAKDGFQAMSVALDDPTDKETRQSVQKFLETVKATFPNFMLDEKEEVWQKKLGIESVPAIFVFGRDGKIVKKFTEDVNYADIEKLTVELLKKK